MNDVIARTIADRTKIGLVFLAALERGDCSWPGGCIDRSFRRYARPHDNATGSAVAEAA